jgi:hypothetical protein
MLAGTVGGTSASVFNADCENCQIMLDVLDHFLLTRYWEKQYKRTIWEASSLRDLY